MAGKLNTELTGFAKPVSSPSPRFVRGLRRNLRYWLAQTAASTGSGQAPTTTPISGIADDRAISRLNPDFANVLRLVEMGLTLPETREDTIALILQCFFWMEKTGHSHLWRPVVERAIGLLPVEPVETSIWLRFRLLKQLGQFEREDRELKTAVSTFQQADKLAYRLEDSQAIAEIRMNLAETYRRQHKYDLAREHGEAALAMFDGENGRLRAITLGVLGRLALAQGDLSEAASLLRESITLQETSNAPYLYRSYDILATIYRRQKHRTQSAQLYQKALMQVAKTSNERDKIIISTNLGGLYHEWEKFSEAEIILQQAETIAHKQSGLLLQKGSIATSLGCVLQEQGELDRAESYHLRAISLYREGDNQLLLANALGNLAEIYVERGQEQLALKNLADGLALLRHYPDNAWAQKLAAEYKELQRVVQS